MSDFNYLMICEICKKQINPQRVPYKGGSCYICWPPDSRATLWIYWWRDEFLSYYQQVMNGSRNQARTLKDTATRIEQVIKAKDRTLTKAMLSALADAYVFKTDRAIFTQWNLSVVNSITTLAALHGVELKSEDLA